VSAAIMVLGKRVEEIGSQRKVAGERGGLEAIGAAFGLAVVCTLTPMALWESFGFGPGGVAMMLAEAGFLAVAAQLIAGRLLNRSGSTGGAAAIGLFLLFAGAGALMWAPQTGLGILLFCGIAAVSLGWGCLGPKISPSNELAWIAGAIISSSVFYAHERTSFALGGLAFALSAVWRMKPLKR
jgi:hypothetical protein